MTDSEPIGFEVDRDNGNGERLRVLYSRPNDRFFQLQESLSETSTFIADQIMKGKLSNLKLLQLMFFTLETQIYTVTELDPILVILPSLLNSKKQ